MARPQPRLIAITDVAQFGQQRTVDAFSRLCSAAAAGSVCVQMRAELSPVTLMELGQRLLDICVKSEQHLSVNERLDVALALGVHAAHLKSRSITAATARRLWERRGKDVWLTRAWHPTDDLLPPEADGLLVSPVCVPRKGRPPMGVDGLRAAVLRAARVPVYALGGVDGSNAEAVVAAGAWGVAAIGACYGDAEPLLRGLGVLRGG